MNIITNGTEIFDILVELTPRPDIQRIHHGYRNENSFYATYVFEVTSEMKFVDENNDYEFSKVPETLVGFWTTEEVIGYNSDSGFNLRDISSAYRCTRVPVTTYDYVRVY